MGTGFSPIPPDLYWDKVKGSDTVEVVKPMIDILQVSPYDPPATSISVKFVLS